MYRTRLRRVLYILLAACAMVPGCALETGDEEDVGAYSDELRRTGHNPVLRNCADPGVMRHRNRWYVVCTGRDFPMYVSENLTEWTRIGHAFSRATRPAWAEGSFWAPELHHVPGGFALYFTASRRGKTVIGVAFSRTPEGPYRDRGRPLLSSRHPILDPHVVKGPSGRPFLFYESLQSPNDAIYVRSLAMNGRALGPHRSRLAIRGGARWETRYEGGESWGARVEGPSVIRRGNWYYMFYSGNTYCDGRYAVGVARRRGDPYGPFQKLPRPILTSGRHWLGPGHNTVTRGPDGRLYMLFHAYSRSQGIPRCAGSPDNNQRHTLIRQIVFRNGWPRTRTGAPGRRARTGFIPGPVPSPAADACGGSAACTDDSGRDVCLGDPGILACPGGTMRCTCGGDGHFDACGTCISD